MNTDIIIRLAQQTDLHAINEIYNESVLNDTATFDTDPKTMEERQTWFQNHLGNYPAIVAQDHGGIIGWASLTRWSDRCAYDGTAEVSVYIHHEHRGRGIGNLLLIDLIKLARDKKLHYLLSRITEGNQVSIHLHQKHGFRTIGVMREVGFKFGRFLDVTLMELVFDQNQLHEN